jgi:tRNA threonylcarbamoyladenosine biosynthesis protein TsaE
MIIEVASEQETKDLGKKIAAVLKGGEVFELIGDVGAGKTTFVKGLAGGLGVDDDVQSPSYTISRVYEARDGLELAHYDFYRLSDPGIMANELQEVVADPRIITVIEWADIVEGVLPDGHFSLRFTSPTETSRRIEVSDTLGARL